MTDDLEARLIIFCFAKPWVLVMVTCCQQTVYFEPVKESGRVSCHALYNLSLLHTRMTIFERMHPLCRRHMIDMSHFLLPSSPPSRRLLQ